MTQAWNSSPQTWAFNSSTVGIGVISMAFYAPSLTSGVAMSTIWLILFSGDRYGYINNLLPVS